MTKQDDESERFKKFMQEAGEISNGVRRIPIDDKEAHDLMVSLGKRQEETQPLLEEMKLLKARLMAIAAQAEVEKLLLVKRLVALYGKSVDWSKFGFQQENGNFYLHEVKSHGGLDCFLDFVQSLTQGDKQ